MANLLSSFLNGSSTFTYNNGTNVIPSYTLVQPTFSNTSTGASIFNQTFGSSSSFGNSLLFGSSLGGSTLTGSFGNSFNVGGFNTSFNYGSLGNGFGFGTIARTSTTPTTTTTPSGTTIATKQIAESNAANDSVLSFVTSDFAYANGDAVDSLQISVLPEYGTLELNGAAVSLNQYIDADDLSDLSYEPDVDFDGTDYFSVKLSTDGTTYDSSNSNVTISVLGENDAPTLDATSLISVVEGETATNVGSAMVNAFNDVDTGDSIGSLTITSISTYQYGTLSYVSDSGSTITISDSSLIGYELSPTEANSLKFSALDNSVASGSYPPVKINFDVTDSYGVLNATADEGTISIQLNDGNDAPTFAATTKTYNTVENDTAITGMVPNPAEDEESNSLLTYSIAGTDSSFFSVNSANGAITFNDAPDHEDHQDSDVNGTYELTLTATDPQGATAVQSLKVLVGNQIQSLNLTALSSAITIDEGETAITTVTAGTNDVSNSISYSISGTDADLFTIDEDNGTLSFVSEPDAENPDDSSSNNSYSITVKATDESEAVSAATKAVTITVNDIEDENVEFIAASAPSTSTPASDYILESTNEGDLEVLLVEGYTASPAENLIALSFTNGESSLTGDLGLTPNLTYDLENSAGTTNFTVSTASNGSGATANYSQVYIQYSSTSTDTLDFEEADEITLTLVATDNEGTSAQTDVTITILDDNESPEYDAPARAGVAVGGTAPIGDSIFRSMTDPENDALTFKITGMSTTQSVNLPGGDVEYDWTGLGHYVELTPGPSAPTLNEVEVRSLRFVEDDGDLGVITLSYEAIDNDGSQIANTDGQIEILIF